MDVSRVRSTGSTPHHATHQKADKGHMLSVSKQLRAIAGRTLVSSVKHPKWKHHTTLLSGSTKAKSVALRRLSHKSR